MCIRLNLSQFGEDWLSWRRTRVTATDTAKILSRSPYGTPYSCYDDKVNPKENKPNYWMIRGTEMEPIARAYLEETFELELDPACFDSTEYPYMGISMDAITKDNKRACEIKCLSPKNVKKMIYGEDVPYHYYLQVQKQMLVLGLEEMGLFFFENPESNKLVMITKNDDVFKEIIEKESAFWKNLTDGKPPEMTAKEIRKTKKKALDKIQE